MKVIIKEDWNSKFMLLYFTLVIPDSPLLTLFSYFNL